MQAQATRTVTVPMIASFARGIYCPVVAPNDTPKKVYERLKNMGARFSEENVNKLMKREATMIGDFEIVDVEGHHVPAEKAPEPTKAAAAPQVNPEHNRRASDKKAGLVSPAPAQAKGRGRAKGRSYDPLSNDTKQLKPAKRGALYAKMLEALVKGANSKDLLSLTTNKTMGGVNDVLSWTVKNLGYGLKYDSASDKHTLVFPAGVKEILYKD